MKKQTVLVPRSAPTPKPETQIFTLEVESTEAAKSNRKRLLKLAQMAGIKVKQVGVMVADLTK